MLPAAQVFVRAAESVDELVRALPGDRWTGWDGPGLGDWDLRALVGHTSRALSTVATYLGRPADRAVVGSAAEYYALAVASPLGQDRAAIVERGRQAGAALGPDPRVGIRRLVDRVVPLVAMAQDQLIETVAGGMWLSDYLPTRTFELAVHGCDIAVATGRTLSLPTEVELAAVTLAGQIAVHAGTGADVLLALTGRTALPDGFSVV